MLEGALAVRRKWFPSPHIDVAESLDALGTFHFETGDMSSAQREFEEGLRILQQAAPEGHPLTLSVMNDLSAVLVERGRFQEAEALARTLLVARRRFIGGETLPVAVTWGNLGAVLAHLGRHAEAEQSFRNAHALLVKLLGPEHWQAANAAGIWRVSACSAVTMPKPSSGFVRPLKSSEGWLAAMRTIGSCGDKPRSRQPGPDAPRKPLGNSGWFWTGWLRSGCTRRARRRRGSHWAFSCWTPAKMPKPLHFSARRSIRGGAILRGTTRPSPRLNAHSVWHSPRGASPKAACWWNGTGPAIALGDSPILSTRHACAVG